MTRTSLPPFSLIIEPIKKFEESEESEEEEETPEEDVNVLCHGDAGDYPSTGS